MQQSNIIPLSGMNTTEFVPPPFDKREAPRPTFILRVPTFAIKDKMAAILFQRGLIPATMSQSRGLLIDALYDLFDEAEADEHASFLEAYWTRSEVHEEIMTAWQIQEAQRLFDTAQGVSNLPPVPIPPAPFTMREQSRQARIMTETLERHERYRAYQSRFMVQQEEEDEMLNRLFIAGWTGIPVDPERDGMDLLTLDCIEAVRGWLRDNDGGDAWDKVKSAVRAQFGAPAVLEKNSDSPLDSNSNPNGLRASSGELVTSNGRSTTSPIGRTPRSKSKGTSAASRGSRSDKSAAKPKTGRTVDPS